jgi:hypothetical protein
MLPEYSTQAPTNGKALEQDFITFLGIYSINRFAPRRHE